MNTGMGGICDTPLCDFDRRERDVYVSVDFCICDDGGISPWGYGWCMAIMGRTVEDVHFRIFMADGNRSNVDSDLHDAVNEGCLSFSRVGSYSFLLTVTTKQDPSGG